MRRRMAVLGLPALVAVSVSACAGGPDTGSATSARVDPVQATLVRTGGVSLRIPPGSASGGTVTLTAATPPDDVPAGLQVLGPAAAVLLAGGTLAAPATLSFAAPSALRPGDLPVVVWRTRTGWTWLPTTWRTGARTVDVSFTQPSAGYLAKVDVASWVAALREGFVDRVTTAADVSPPYCAGQAEAANAGPPSGSDPGTQVRWCRGVEDGRPVLRVTNETKLVSEVTFPLAWAPGAGEGAAGSAVRSALGIGTAPPVGRAARYLGGGETLTLHPGAGSTGLVTAELTPTAWVVSALIAAADAYASVAVAANPVVGRVATALDRGLPVGLAAGLAPRGTGSPALRDLGDCLAPVAAPETLDPASATALLAAALRCTPRYFARPLARTGPDPAGVRLASHVAAVVLRALRRDLTGTAASWPPFAGATRDSAYRIWLGPPPPAELDYGSAPMVFRAGEPVDVPAWPPDFRAYVRERLHSLRTDGQTSQGCAQGTFAVRRYRSDGFALAEQVGCDGAPRQLVLAKQADGWQEIDDTPSAADEPGHYFSCELMRGNAVPAFIVGDQCISGTAVEDYP